MLPQLINVFIGIIAVGLFAGACLLSFSSSKVDDDYKPVKKEKRVMFRHLF